MIPISPRLFFRSAALLAGLLLIAGCGREAGPKLFAVAGLPPVADLAQRIAGPEFAVRSAMPVGRSPHDFSPRPGEIRDIAGARLFLQTGMPFEQSIAKALAGGRTRVVDVSSEIHRIPLEGGCGHDHGGNEAAHAGHRHENGVCSAPDAAHPHDAGAHDDDDHDHGAADGLDPHVWLSPANCRLIAAAIARAMAEAAPEHAATFAENYRRLDAELAAIEREMAERLAPYRGRSFFVHHAAFGYFAHAAGLVQHGIELSGREPTPARLSEVIRLAREHRVKTIFVQPQFNPTAARALARAIDGEAAELDPLGPDALDNFRRLTDMIIKGFEHR